MSTNPTYSAACPITGTTHTRSSAHPYTHAVCAIIVRIDARRTPGVEELTVRTRGQKLPTGFLVCRQPGRACWGHAVHYLDGLDYVIQTVADWCLDAGV